MISHFLQKSRMNAACNEVIAKLNQGNEANPLPKKFSLKLVTEVHATPSEFADALCDENQRPNWELKLKQIKKKTKTHLNIEYIGITNPHDVFYNFEILPPKNQKQTLTNFLANEHTSINQGLTKTDSLYLLEEISNRPGIMRVTFFCSVNSEDEGRNKLKRFISLRIMLSISDRKGAPVGNLAEITTKAKTIAYDENVDVVTEEEEEQDDSQEDDGIESVKGEIEPTEAPDIEEADNMTPNNEESKTP